MKRSDREERNGKMQTTEIKERERVLQDIKTETEKQLCDIGGASAVLREAIEYFEDKMEPGSFEANYLIMRQDHILNLFYAAENMLYDLEKRQRMIIDQLYEKTKREKASA
jgi:hypothetical protein